jgi:hypothetical protein
MKFHVIDVLTFYGKSDRIDAFHARMFHGEADRGGHRPASKNARVGHAVDRPLRLHKNAYQIADVFSPEFLLVVSSAVRQALGSISRLHFTPVTFATLFSYPYNAGDFSFWDSLTDYQIQQEFIDQQTNDPELQSQVGEYFEMLAPPFRDLKGRFEGIRRIPMNTGPTKMDAKEIPVCEQMLEDCPVYSIGATVTSDEVFTGIEPFIDWTYFTHAEGKL